MILQSAYCDGAAGENHTDVTVAAQTGVRHRMEKPLSAHSAHYVAHHLVFGITHRLECVCMMQEESQEFDVVI